MLCKASSQKWLRSALYENFNIIFRTVLLPLLNLQCLYSSLIKAPSIHNCCLMNQLENGSGVFKIYYLFCHFQIYCEDLYVQIVRQQKDGRKGFHFAFTVDLKYQKVRHCVTSYTGLKHSFVFLFRICLKLLCLVILFRFLLSNLSIHYT